MPRSRTWEKTHRKEMREIQDRYYQTDKGRAARARVQRAYRKRNPEKVRAQHRLQEAVKHSRVTRPSECEQCEAECKPQAHHHLGYEPEFWYDVRWLCAACHKAVHL